MDTLPAERPLRSMEKYTLYLRLRLPCSKTRTSWPRSSDSSATGHRPGICPSVRIASTIQLNHSSACLKLPLRLMWSAISSRSWKARGAISTRKAMFLPKSPLRLFEGYALPVRNLLHSLPDGRHGLGPIEAIEQSLIGLGILDDQLSSSIDRQNQGIPSPFETSNVIFEIPLKAGNRANFAKVDRHLSL